MSGRFGVPNTELSVSVVIGTKDRPASLERCLRSIVGQTRLPDEILIIDDGHLDAEAAIKTPRANAIPTRYFNKSSDPGLTKSRNLGIRESFGDIVLFIDDDVILESGYLAAIVDVYRSNPNIGGVGGRLTNAELPVAKRAFLRFFLLDSARDGTILPNGVGVLIRTITTITQVHWLSGCNMSFSRDVFAELMFDERFAGNGWGDDRDFSYRVGRRYGLLATPFAAVHHAEEPSGRLGRAEFGKTEITYMFRFFVKHMPSRPHNLMALGWGFAGIVLHNCVALRPARVWGNLAGIWQVTSNPSRFAHGEGA